MSDNQLTPPSLKHFIKLTDQIGMIQHCIKNKPDLTHGYATDDNARALIAINELILHNQVPDLLHRQLQRKYFNFLKRAYFQDGFYCYLDSDGKPLEFGQGPWSTRATMAIAHLLHHNSSYQDEANAFFNQLLPIILDYQKVDFQNLSLRSLSFVVFTIFYYQQTKSKDQTIMANLIKICQQINSYFQTRFNTYTNKDWVWIDNKITYDNGKLIQSFLLNSILLGQPKIAEPGLKMLDFYLSITYKNNYFQAPGNKGFWTKKQHPLFDEQALETYSLVAALTSAFLLTNKQYYLDIGYDVYQWFYGKNRLNITMLDTDTEGVFDGLKEANRNLNQGAESILSLVLAFLCLKYRINL